MLIENGISVRANKVMVARCSGAGSVVGYNYMDMGYISSNGSWHEIGLNASHMVGPHHMLFEGNYAFNADSDNTHGNSIYHTFFRNQLRGIRAPFRDQNGGALIDDANQSGNGPARGAGLMAYSYWMSFLGNVLGAPGQMGGWVYETTFGGKRGIWMLGWDDQAPYRVDAKVSATTLRHGNFDYVTNTVIWDPTLPNHTLPELPLPSPEAGLLQRRERLHLAMGGPGGSDQALHAAGQGALRRRDTVHAALKTAHPRFRRRRANGVIVGSVQSLSHIWFGLSGARHWLKQ